MTFRNFAGSAVLVLAVACSRESKVDEAAPAPVDTGAETGQADTLGRRTSDTVTMPAPGDTMARRPDTSMATPPISPAPSATGQYSAQDTPPQQSAGKGGKVSKLEYEGWRQYSVNCARCHGQDALPNPVAANLLVSLGAGGPIGSPEKFAEIVLNGRTASGMPAFKGIVSREQSDAIYAYVKGRAEGRIPPGRPEKPQA